MSLPGGSPQVLDFFDTALAVGSSPGQLCDDVGLLPIRPFDQHIGLTLAFVDARDDPRNPDRIEHPFLAMVRARVFGVLADCEGQNDHDTLQADPSPS